MRLFVSVPSLCLATVRPPSISVANPKSGDFVAPQVAQSVADVYNAENILYLTDEAPGKRIQDIIDRIQTVRRCHDGPFYVMSYGGDGTFQNVIQATLQSLYPNVADLMDASVQSITERIMTSGIRLGLVRVGTENDVGRLSGSPLGEIGAVLTYYDDSILSPLNLGIAQYLDQVGRPLPNIIPSIIPHNVSAGTVIAKTFQDTSELRGSKSRRQRWWTGFKLGLKRTPFRVQWHDSTGRRGTLTTPEIFVHATPLAGGSMGFPGVSPAGLAVKIFPDIAFSKAIRLTAEISRLGRSFLKGNADCVGPEATYRHMETERQLQIPQGERMTFQFMTLDDTPLALPVQLCGDFVCPAYGMIVRALPQFPFHMAMQDSLLRRRLIQASASIAH